jgi:uncharacterized membrane protein
MKSLSDVLAVLPWPEWVALAWFFVAWIGYARFAKRRAGVQQSLLAASNRVRRQWMLQATKREVRVVDGVVVQNPSTSPSFFASTTILIIGGLLAMLLDFKLLLLASAPEHNEFDRRLAVLPLSL